MAPQGFFRETVIKTLLPDSTANPPSWSAQVVFVFVKHYNYFKAQCLTQRELLVSRCYQQFQQPSNQMDLQKK